MLVRNTYLTLGIAFVILVSACSPVRYLKDNEYLLTSVKLIEKEHTEAKDASEYLRIKPNTKLLGLFRLRLQLHNLYKPGKEHWFARKFKELGEAPVLYDAQVTAMGAERLSRYYFNMGYFDNEVEIALSEPSLFRKKRKKISFYINPGSRYEYRNIRFDTKTPELAPLVDKFLESSSLKNGTGYNAELLSAERKALTAMIRNDGYYYFAEQYVFFEVDSAIAGNLVDLRISIQNSYSRENDSVSTDHRKYRIGNIYIRPDYDPSRPKDPATHLLEHKGYFIKYNTLKYKPRALTEPLLISPGIVFNQTRLNNSYNQLSDLKGFSTINIHFKESDDTSRHLLDAYVQLHPIPKWSVGVELEGTHRVGNWGTALNLSFKNRNIFRGNEILEIRPTLAFETLSNLVNSENSGIFNTFEYGVETHLRFPRYLLPFDTEGLVPKSYSPKSTISLVLNKQQRRDFTRKLFQSTLGYQWKEGRHKTHNINLIDITYIKLEEGASIDISKNPFLAALFTDQLITASSYQFIYNNQNISSRANFTYFRGNLEWSGNIANAIGKSLNNSNGEALTLFGSPFAQYVKIETDYRHYFHFNNEGSLVFRTFIGRGLAYGNSEAMPFGKQFFAGGANGIRAWTAYQLGPVSFNADSVSFNTGDIKGTINLEYRFKIAGNFLGAIFSDCGNIWNSIKSEQVQDSDFQFSTFHKQIAVGAGIGLRYDFGFFILRCDIAQQLKDPTVQQNQGWVVNDFGFDRTRINLGLGYPF